MRVQRQRLPVSCLAVELTPLCAVGGALLEGPSWDADRQRLLFVDILRAEALAFDWSTRALSRIAMRETCSAWIPRRGGGSAVVCRTGVRLLDPGDELHARIPLEPDLAGNRSNDAKCDPRGRMWVGTMADPQDPAGTPTGGLYRIEGSEVMRVLGGVAISNGLGWSPGGHRMYYVDTPTRRVDVLDYDADTGAPANRRPLADVRHLPGVPDGLAVDADGGLWVAFYDGWAVHRFSAAGEHLACIPMEVARPTSCAFAGPGLDQLVITTAADADGMGGDPYVCAPGVTGLPVVPFAG